MMLPRSLRVGKHLAREAAFQGLDQTGSLYP